MTSNVLTNIFEILNHRDVRCLLIGGYACVIYGAKTSTVDLDITILTSPENIQKLERSLKDLHAKPSIASIPPDPALLARGHSLHYYCEKDGFEGIRLDILGKLPRLDDFSKIWNRRFEYKLKEGCVIPILSIPDLIQSKKTGRIKDAADISALVNSHFISNRLNPQPAHIKLWLTEAREADVLLMLVKEYQRDAKELVKLRPLLMHAITEDIVRLKIALIEEAGLETIKHEKFRGPLRKEAKEIARGKNK